MMFVSLVVAQLAFSVVFYCASRGLKTLLLEGNSKLGGRLHYFLDMPIYDLPGQYGVTAQQYLLNLVQQLEKSTTQIKLNEQVKAIHYQDIFTIETATNVYRAKTTINATGTGYIQHKKLQSSHISSEALKHIRYEVPDELNSTKKVGIIGHTPLAIDWAIQLIKKQIDVVLIASKPISLQPILMDELKQLNIPIMSLQEIQIEYINSSFFIQGEAYTHIFCHVGTIKQSMTLPCKITQMDNAYTSLTGYFVAGDARFEPGKIKLIHGATHDAMQASNAAYQHLYPNETYQPIVSTHHPIFTKWNQH